MKRTNRSLSFGNTGGVVAQVALVALAVSYLALSAIDVFTPERPVSAQTTSSLWWVDLSSQDSDGVYNFDFKDDEVSSTAVDWPMRFLFYKNAEIDKVKDALSGCYTPYIPVQACSSGGAQYAYFYDQDYGYWDFDGGIKQANSCGSSGAHHIRLYANGPWTPPYDRNHSSGFSIDLGYYIYGSIHLDHEGGSGGFCTSYYSTETQETWWIQRMLDYLPGWAQQSNSYYWYNLDSPGHGEYIDGKYHYTQSNAWTGYVEVD